MTRRTSRRMFCLLLAVVLGLGLTSACAAGGGDRTVTVELRDAAGLFEGNDVGILGVRVGEVERVEPAGDRVRVRLRLDDDVDVPADAAAVVVSRSVATDRYVELTPVYAGGPRLADGATIGLDRTRTPVEFDELLASLGDLAEGLGESGDGAGPLGRLLAAAADNLEGNGRFVRDGTADLADVLEEVEDHLGDVEGTVTDLDTLTTALVEDDDLVRRFTTEVADATQMLDEQHESLEATFDALAAMVRQVADFVRTNGDRLGAQMDDFAALASDLNARQVEFQQLLDDGPLMLQNLVRAIDEDDRLSFRTRPLDLVPGEAAVGQLCASFPEGLCESLRIQDLPLFDLLRTLAGVRDQ